MAKNPFDDLASAYDSWFDGKGKNIFASEVAAFQPLLPLTPKPWLEIGTGSGRFAHALGIEIGIDPSIKLLEIARKRGITGFLGRGEALPFTDQCFGTVFLIVTLCFVDSPRDLLLECYRVLRSEGKVVLGLILRDSPWGRFYKMKKGEGHNVYKHAIFYSYDDVSRLLKQAGFAIADVVSTLFQKPGEVHEIETPREGFSDEAGFTVIAANKITR